MSDDEFERKLFLCRNQIEDQAESQGIKDFYIPSFSSRTIVYKGLLAAPTLERFYLDLRDPNYTTALAVFHQRYSTNTFPDLAALAVVPDAQPQRRDQHRRGQPALDQGARAGTEEPALRRRDQEAAPHHPARRQRFRPASTTRSNCSSWAAATSSIRC